jgi:cytochrome c oxidase subunit 2
MFRLTSNDVIHSFWVPNLSGKRDLIPGHLTTLHLEAANQCTYRGQCAEYCGMQHAHMGLLVIAEPEKQFEAWLDQQRRPAIEPGDGEQKRGRDVFLNSPCVICHTIRGTGAFGSIGPDLTHLATRQTLAAATLPNTMGHLGGWITDSQSIKPGNLMPPVPVAPEDLQPLLEYLKTLK